MLVKVCGITRTEQYTQLDSLGVDMLGLNFYHASPRYVAPGDPVSRLSGRASKVGIFVNPCVDRTLATIRACGLDYVQLHGHESVAFCRQMKKHAGVIKAFGIDDAFDFAVLNEYATTVDYFLFDRRSSRYGGSGRKFNWQKLAEYDLEVPFLLSGGLAPDDWPALLDFSHPQWAGIDINSGFETAPGNKDLVAVAAFLEKIKT